MAVIVNVAKRLDLDGWHDPVWNGFCVRYFYGPLRSPMATVWAAHDIAHALSIQISQGYVLPRRRNP